MIKKFFEKDSALKIVSVFIALLVWLYVIYIEDPEIEMTVDDVPVSYKTADLSSNLSLVEYDIKTVDVKISGNRSDVMEVEADDITAVLDISSISEAGKYDKVKINVSTSNRAIEIIDSSDDNSSVKIDNIISKQFDVDVEFEGDMPDGYIVSDEPYPAVKSISVKGAKTYVDKIKGAYIKINCKGLSQSKSVDCSVYLKDTDGKIIDEKHKAYKYLELSDKNMSAYVTVGKTSKATVEVSGLDESVKVSVSPSEIEIYNKNGTVNKIYTESIEGKKADNDGNIVLKLKIPNGVTVVNGETSVKVKVEND